MTHDMGSVKKYCTRAMMIADGKMQAIGDPESISQQYTLANLEAERVEAEARQEALGGYANGLNERCPILRTRPVSLRSTLARSLSASAWSISTTSRVIFTWL